jgi:hypothetical protein
LLARIAKEQSTGNNFGQGLREGQRNTGLFKQGAGLRGLGRSEEEILRELLLANEERCEPPLSVREVKRIARNASQFPPNAQQENSSAKDKVSFELTEEHVIAVISKGGKERRIAICSRLEVLGATRTRKNEGWGCSCNGKTLTARSTRGPCRFRCFTGINPSTGKFSWTAACGLRLDAKSRHC